MNYNLILFDLDGTLLDSSLGVLRSFQHALAYFNQDVSRETLVAKIGPPAPEIFMQLFPDIFSAPNNLRKAMRLQRTYYSTIGVKESERYAGIEEVLKTLHQAGKKICVATSKPTIYAKKILSHHGLDHYFEWISGSTLNLSRSKKIDVITHVLKKYSRLPLTEIIMVGDTHHDINAAQATKINSLGVTYGFGSKRDIHFSAPTHCIDNISELLRILL